MSFENTPKRPSLVEKKILKFVNMKKQKKIQIEQEKIEQIKIEQENTTFNKISTFTIDFIKENYGFVLLVLLICLLLFVRYIECIKRKEKIKEIVAKHVKKEDSETIDIY
jgi:predicted PurR-regulated permease PerM